MILEVGPLQASALDGAIGQVAAPVIGKHLVTVASTTRQLEQCSHHLGFINQID